MQKRVSWTTVVAFGVMLALDHAQAQQDAPLEDVVREAAGRSTLAASGGVPFHLKATISDEKKHDPQWDAEVEEWWQSPTVWRREFHSKTFSQTLVVNGAAREEHIAGPVFPELLRNLTVELVDTVPRFDQLAALHIKVDKPDGTPGQIKAKWEIPGSDGTTTRALAASIAISRETGLFVYGGDIDWDVALHDFADFHGKQIARRLTAQSQGGPQLTAKVTLLEDLAGSESAGFVIRRPTPAKHQLRVVVVPEGQMRKLILQAPQPKWPAVQTGPLSGTMVMRIVVDREGNVRSVDDFFSDNPALQVAAQEQMMRWKFRPYPDRDASVQVISTLTFPFSTTREESAAGAQMPK
ncbi:energy transducer TonB [Granulicella sibirica]|nr:energy transducer TonB [Granulicella sibirica]